jgi:hypothetical protein
MAPETVEHCKISASGTTSAAWNTLMSGRQAQAEVGVWRVGMVTIPRYSAARFDRDELSEVGRQPWASTGVVTWTLVSVPASSMTKTTYVARDRGLLRYFTVLPRRTCTSNGLGQSRFRIAISTWTPEPLCPGLPSRSVLLLWCCLTWASNDYRLADPATIQGRSEYCTDIARSDYRSSDPALHCCAA